MWLSLVEYLNGVQVVVGSNPAIPTKLKTRSFARGAGFFALYPPKYNNLMDRARIRIAIDLGRRM
jgi:hypothetical protein